VDWYYTIVALHPDGRWAGWVYVDLENDLVIVTDRPAEMTRWTSEANANYAMEFARRLRMPYTFSLVQKRL
jgi:hypothetical protein